MTERKKINGIPWSDAVKADGIEKPELEVWLCPIHRNLDDRGDLKPLNNCVACIRNERDELKEFVEALDQGEKRLLAELHEQFGEKAVIDTPDAEATFYLILMLSLIAKGWKVKPPENGFVTALPFTDIGILEIEVRKIDGKPANVVITEMQKDIDELRSQRDGLLSESGKILAEYASLRAEISRLKGQIAAMGAS